MGAPDVSISSATLRGAQALPVSVEVSVSGGIPGFTIVGMPDAEVLEARARVRCALKACGFELPRMHFTINLAPGEVRKSGTGFDLPIAVAILASTRQIPAAGLERCLFVGELALDGEVSAVRGAVAFEALAHELSLVLVGACGQGSAFGNLRTLTGLGVLRGGVERLGEAPPLSQRAYDGAGEALVDFADVFGQEEAKRACVIAAAGGHGMLMIGPPGAGKTMLARRMPTILSPMSDKERSETMVIHSVAGEPTASLEAGIRPFRAPHHSISVAGLIGGGRPVQPGEVSLAHRGVLFLDELSEFANNVLQALRQPLEDHEVRLVRADGLYAFPCSFQLVAASNPCPCGHLGDPGHPCACSPAQVQRYQSKIGGPLLDRIDVVVNVSRPASGKVIAGEKGLESAAMAEEVGAAREFRAWREARGAGKEPSGLSGQMSEQARSRFEAFATRKALGGRSLVRVARVARTVADLGRHERIETEDIIEACSYRSRS